MSFHPYEEWSENFSTIVESIFLSFDPRMIIWMIHDFQTTMNFNSMYTDSSQFDKQMPILRDLALAYGNRD